MLSTILTLLRTQPYGSRLRGLELLGSMRDEEEP